MGTETSSLLIIVFALFVLFFSNHATAFNITKILGNYSQFSSFNDLLTNIELASKINKRQTITLLALDNGATDLIRDRSSEELETILSNHVVLDYYDSSKLKKLDNKGSTLTTLYQTTGSASDKSGFLNVKQPTSGDILFGSGVKGSPLVSKLVKSVYSQPFNLSILQVSLPIVAPGIGEPILPPPPPPYSAPPPSSSSKKTPRSSKSPTQVDIGADDSSEAPSSDPPADMAAAPSPTDTPAPSPKETPADDLPDFVGTPPHSGASTMYIGSSIGVAGVMAFGLNLAGF